MFPNKIIISTLAVLAFISYEVFAADAEVSSARIESCRGCQLNRLPDVKKFIFEDVPKYENVEFKPIQGAPPILLLLDKNGDEIEKISLSSLNRDECNNLLKGNGFTLKKENREL